MNRSADGWMWGDAYGHLAEDAADAWHQQREVEQRRQLEELQACYLEDLAKLRKLQALQAELDALEQDLPK